METQLSIKEEQILYKHTLVCEVELTNGKKTKVIVIFNNNELNFEEVNSGMNFAFGRCRNIYKNSNTFCKIESGEIKPFATFQERVNNKNKDFLTTLNDRCTSAG